MKVACCTYYSPSYKALADISLPNLSEYCARHGYYMWVENIENDKWEYVKHEMFKRLFEEGFDLIWYKDVDSVITNMRIPITDFIDEGHDFFITKDVNELNGGSVVIKNTDWGRVFNKAVLNNKGILDNEQNAYVSLYEGAKPGIVNTMKILPHPSINSYDYSLYQEFPNIRKRKEGHWHEGDFVLHTPGAPMEVRLNTLKNVKIIR